MQRSTLILLLSLLFCTGFDYGGFTSTGLSAQSTSERAKKRAAKRAENKANNKLDQKVDQAVDDTFNALEGLFKKKNKKNKEQSTDDSPARDGEPAPNGGDPSADEEEAGQALSNLFGGGGDFEPFTNETSFSMDMEIVSTKRNGKEEEMIMKMAITRTQIGQESIVADKGRKADARSIFDTQTGKIIMITQDGNGESTAMRMKAPNLKKMSERFNATPEDYLKGISYEETGETKVIDGYNTRKFVVTNANDGSTTESWVTTETGIKTQDLYKAMMSVLGGGGEMSSSSRPPIDGIAIHSISTTKKGERVEMRYKNIKVGETQMDKSILDVSGLEIMDIPGF